jgi:hypothetical protein
VLKADEIMMPDTLRKEQEFIRSRNLMPQIQRAFNIANVDFGRIDFTVEDGCVRVFEINTTPDLGTTRLPDHPRYEILRQNKAEIAKGLITLDGRADAEYRVLIPGKGPERARVVSMYDNARFNANQCGKRLIAEQTAGSSRLEILRFRLMYRGWLTLRDTLAFFLPVRYRPAGKG